MDTPVTPKMPLKDFMLAGNSTFTVVSQATQARFTYRVVQGPKPNLSFVQLMVGPDNENSFKYLGHIWDKARYVHGHKSRIQPNSPAALAFVYVAKYILAGQVPPKVDFYHEGRCCKCGRKLTVPSSIEMGMGPECASIYAQAQVA